MVGSAARVGRLVRGHAEIADAAEARANSRRIMDIAAGKLAEVLAEADDARRVPSRAPAPDASNPGGLAGDARRRLEGPRGGTPAEQLAHALLARVLGPASAAGPPSRVATPVAGPVGGGSDAGRADH